MTDILDYMRDCVGVAAVASRREMFGYGDEVDTMIADLRTAEFCLCMAERHTSITNKSWIDQTPMKLAHLIHRMAGIAGGCSVTV